MFISYRNSFHSVILTSLSFLSGHDNKSEVQRKWHWLHSRCNLDAKIKELGRSYSNFTFQTSPTKCRRVVGFAQECHQIAKHMQTTCSPTKIVGAGGENKQFFINHGTTIIVGSSNIDFLSQNPTVATAWKANDQVSDIRLD